MEQRICCPWGGGIFTYSFEKNRRQRRSLHLPQLCGNKVLTTGQTYAFLNGIFNYDDGVSALGAGAILKATDVTNRSAHYIKNKYGTNAEVKVYVDVVTPGKDFDNCVVGGLYEVPNSGTPTGYRYFCGYGGAQNCGPYYAYNYEKESITSGDISASLNDIEKQGSGNSKDYTVTITYDTEVIQLSLLLLTS